MMPGPTVRPVLMRESWILEDASGIQYGALVVAYGSGVLRREERQEIDLILEYDEALALGLHKATRFSMDARDRKQLPWAEEYFVAPPFVVGRSMKIGSLNEAQIARIAVCLSKRTA